MVNFNFIYIYFLILVHFSNCKLNESMITDLKNKLNNAENKLTDIRLEALSSIHQIDQLKECMDKMKVDYMFSS